MRRQAEAVNGAQQRPRRVAGPAAGEAGDAAMAGPGVARLARVTGRVQGVFFRAWTQAEARRLGLAGWVRNEPDGSVTALVAGPEAAVAEMLRRLHDGPPAARVAAVETAAAEPPEGPGFHILR